MEAARVRAANASEVVCAAWASELVRGVAWLEDVGAKWVRPHRFWPEQERALGSCAAWYPGIYRQMAPCCAGVRLEFETDASELVLEIALDAEPTATSRVLAGVAEKGLLAPGAHDALAVDVDGKRLADVPLDGVEPLAERGARGSEVAFELTAGAASAETAPSCVRWSVTRPPAASSSSAIPWPRASCATLPRPLGPPSSPASVALTS